MTKAPVQRNGAFVSACSFRATRGPCWRGASCATTSAAFGWNGSTEKGTEGTGTPWKIRGMVGWFGLRGIGSLYYLMFAIQHGLPEELALQLMHLTLMVVALSILVHGTSVKPLMERFWRPRKHA